MDLLGRKTEKTVNERLRSLSRILSDDAEATEKLLSNFEDHLDSQSSDHLLLLKQELQSRFLNREKMICEAEDYLQKIEALRTSEIEHMMQRAYKDLVNIGYLGKEDIVAFMEGLVKAVNRILIDNQRLISHLGKQLKLKELIQEKESIDRYTELTEKWIELQCMNACRDYSFFLKRKMDFLGSEFGNIIKEWETTMQGFAKEKETIFGEFMNFLPPDVTSTDVDSCYDKLVIVLKKMGKVMDKNAAFVTESDIQVLRDQLLPKINEQKEANICQLRNIQDTLAVEHKLIVLNCTTLYRTVQNAMDLWNEITKTLTEKERELEAVCQICVSRQEQRLQVQETRLMHLLRQLREGHPVSHEDTINKIQELMEEIEYRLDGNYNTEKNHDPTTNTATDNECNLNSSDEDAKSGLDEYAHRLKNIFKLIKVDPRFLQDLGNSVRKNFTQHLEDTRKEMSENTERILAGKLEDLARKLERELYIQQKRTQNIIPETLKERQQEIQLHKSRISKFITEVTSNLQKLEADNDAVVSSVTTTKCALSKEMSEAVTQLLEINSSKRLKQKVESLKEKDKSFKNDQKLKLQAFRQQAEKDFIYLRQSTVDFIQSVRTFTDSGTYSVQELEGIPKNLEYLSKNINSSEKKVLFSLQEVEKSVKYDDILWEKIFEIIRRDVGAVT
ncbi:coiled-coil domain-containing protein 158-like [Limulus polyphemus]|uniref:Coiled-coil domain-containing protein 158-like n=1 Tax=Limulus polyphemus TaxID=6850 RepID=A0ABM1C511_LIMPO|nr:coiled-coil domain-containing protein 158-like [Limulus polyphemus]